MISIMLLMIVLQVIIINVESKTYNETVTCPSLSRTRYKELRTVYYDECKAPFNICFQQIVLTEIILNEHLDFLYASGCASKKILKPFNSTESKFRELCQQEGINRCIHSYNNTIYNGTLCCEKNSDRIFSSWLWDVFFGDSEEMAALLENTVSFVRSEIRGKADDHEEAGKIYIVGPLLVTVIFTVLSLLQYYHINDGIFT